MANFNDAIMVLKNMGIADVLIPFMLVFTIVFAIAEKVNLLGKKKEDGSAADSKGRTYHAVIAFALGMAVVIPHVAKLYPNSRYDVVNIINQALPNVSVIVIAIVAALILIGAVGLKFQPGESSLIAAGLWIAAFAAVLFVFGSAAGWFWTLPPWLHFLTDSDTQALIVVVLVFVAVMAFITKPALDATKKKENSENRRKALKEAYEGFK